MKTTSILFVILLIVAGTSAAQEARQIAEKSSKVIEFESLEMISTLKIYDAKGNVRVRQVANYTRKFGEITKTLIRFLAPPDIKGTSMLIFDYENKTDDMWLYLPSLRKTRRIVSTEKSRSFMGSEFSNADMAQPGIDDFTYVIKGSVKEGSSEYWNLEAKTRDDATQAELGYKSKMMTIEKATFLPVKIAFFDKSGILLKTMSMEDYHKQSNGKYFAYKMIMTNEVNKRHSEISVDKFKLGTTLSESNFTGSSLEGL